MRRIQNLISTLPRKYFFKSEYFKNTLDTLKNLKTVLKLFEVFCSYKHIECLKNTLFFGRSRDLWIAVGHWQ